MKFARALIPGTLVRRYKRFLADVELEDGTVITAHCPNPGAMLGLNMPGLRVWLEGNDDPRKKLKYGWRLVELPNDGVLTGGWAGIDTGVPNKVVGEALRTGRIEELADYHEVRAEVKYGTGSRIDFLLTDPSRPDCYVEVKNVHLRRTGDWAEFPDSVTARGAKHLDELSKVVAAGDRAVMLYVVQRDDCAAMRLAGDIDPAYVAAFDDARSAGVEIIVYGTTISVEGVVLAQSLPFSAAHVRKRA
ncbi:MAG: DNA/RNA nuclease SfsA [Pseudomonadota bacterium]